MWFLGKTAEFDGHSLNGFEVIYLSERGEVSNAPPVRIGLKEGEEFHSSICAGS